MKLSKILKLDMEICYVPVAKLKDVQEMMSNWKRNNKLIRYWCFASIAISFMNLYYLNFSESQGDVALAITACMISDFIMAMLALLVNRSQKIIYYLSFIGAMLFSFSASFIGFEAITLPAAMALSVPFFVTMFFSYKAIYNYENVYLKLKARKGFPNFVLSTADMYADKIYLKNKDEKTVAEKRVEASFNSFNEDTEITDEEVRRMNTLRYEELKQHEKDVSGYEYFKSKEVKHYYDGNKKYKYGLSFLGIDIIIPHDDIETSSKEEKRRFMRLWNQMKDSLFKNEALLLMFLLFANIVMIVGGLGFGTVVYYVVLGLYVLGTNLVKMDERAGFFLTVGSVYSYLFALLNVSDGLAATVVVVVVAYFTIFVLPRLIKWLLNYPVYKKLSKEEGFPSFFESKKELYGDDYRIVEEIKPLEKRTDREKLIMNIGYGEDEEINRRIADFNYKEKNKENQGQGNTAWNAFNYLETDTENSAYDEFAIYEEINRRRKEAEYKEETIKPDKEMGRRKRDED